jgi:hypothetical protein
VTALTSGVSDGLKEAGCPLAQPLQERLGFETLLAELSATFVNVPPDEVDAQITRLCGGSWSSWTLTEAVWANCRPKEL